MTDTPLVTVVMPCFNAVQTVERAIDSVMAQTYDNFELILVNDASTDATAEVIAAVLARLDDPRLRFLDLDQNVGPSGVRNAALRAATGTFVAFLDSDDEFLPGFLQHHVTSLVDGVDISIAGHYVMRADGTQTARHSAFLGESSGLDAMREAMLDNVLPFAWDRVYRRSLFDGVAFPEGSTRFEDMTINIILLSRAGRVVSAPTPLNRYYISAQSLTWGRIPSQQDSALALADLQTHLPAELRAGRYAKPYAAMRLLITMIVAQSAIMKMRQQPQARHTVDECRAALTLPEIAATAAVKPKFAAAALLLKVAPTTFARIYLRYSATSYGLEP